ncbi:MAG: hypothetical protein QGI68_18565 [Pseudomonadales bacterium]|jgi:pyruvate-ferredoxin/flavodoxin oxidoreductase|nr:hypothetical protein [Pseudomonadales bacterium]MDP7359418.1 hypothetical protein [Pseudomonadales bacterium]MDP7597549.1 hypothetical protein [Pseudomonadales bacterium]HJN51034.1 hypothetical protein [Pseudomonadales bacterium]|tara:strand:- start:23409 stop:28100 length:4692 start_codon:yes stop_codon:yes gene_type:complete
MPDLTTTAIRLYRTLFGAPPGSTLAEEGVDTVLDGNSAVALSEAMIAQDAVMGGSFPTGSADLAWRSESGGANLFGGSLAAHQAEGPRGAVAAAIGLALAGRRVTSFLSGPDIGAVQDLLVSAAGRNLPIVLHLSNRAMAAHGAALGSGHEAFHLSADSGFFTLFAANVQEAADFTFIARRVAEQTLTPGLVVMDGELTALSAQNLCLLSPAQVEKFLGPADGQIEVPTAAQKLLFGDTRRRVPRWYDLDRPVLQGALFGPESYALGAAAQKPYFNQQVSESLRECYRLFAQHTGREYGPVSTHMLDDASLVLVAQGAAQETARGVADYLRRERKTPIGVLGINNLRPFPAAEVVDRLKGKQAVAVLERLDAPLASDSPLLREIRTSLDRALESGSPVLEYPHLEQRELPVCQSVHYGVGGQPLRARDLIALSARLADGAGPTLYLGADFGSAASAHPKRQVLLDTLRRAYPDTATLAVRGSEVPADLVSTSSISIAIHRLTGRGHEDLACQTGTLLQRLEAGQVRTRPGLSWERWGSCCVDRILHAADGLQDPGDDLPIDLAVVAAQRIHAQMDLGKNLASGGVLLIQSAPESELTAEQLQLIEERQLRVFCLPDRLTGSVEEPPDTPELAQTSEATELDGEYLLGGVIGSLLAQGLLDQKERRVVSAREEILAELPIVERNASLQAFTDGLEKVQLVDTEALSAASPVNTTVSEEAPAAVQHLGGDRPGRSSDSYDSLPRFWDQIGVLYRNGEVDTMAADPYLATGTIPPLSATFRDLSESRTSLPVYDPALCTGCGKCWTGCPDSAIGVVAVSPAALIDTGIRLTGADPLRPITSQLSSRIISQAKIEENQHGSAGDMIKAAFQWLGEKMSLAEERKQAIEAGIADVVEKIGPLPVAVTEPFYHRAEAVAKDSAELLSLVVNPDACKACGLCTSLCEAQALDMAPQDADKLKEARELWRIWAETPDTPSETIERVSTDPDVGSMAAVMLSRYCLLALSGGDGAEAGSGEKVAMRMALAATEYQQQPVQHLFAEELAAIRDEVSGLIRATITDALPTEDLDALLHGLDQIQSPQVDLSALTSKLENDDNTFNSSFNSADLRRLLQVTKQLSDLHWRLSEGPNGLGRARFGLAVAPGSVATWAGVFPHNPFQVPVVIDMTGDVSQLAAGLLQGQIRATTEAVGVMRTARLEIDQPSGVDWQRAAIERLTWLQLTAQERLLCPPLFLVGDDEILAGRGFSQITWLLNSELPIKILIMAELDFGLTGSVPSELPLAPVNNPRANIGLLALAQQKAYVAQSSISAPDHLRESIRAAIVFAGPALIHVHAPSPQRHGFAPDHTFEQASLAVASRTFPLFRYDPEGEGVFGSRLDLEGNPEPLQTWQGQDESELLTPADWAFTETRFKHCFRVIEDQDPAPIPLVDWLQLESNARSNKTPCLTGVAGEDEISYVIDSSMLDVVVEREQNWRALQELAGLVTPFTARVEQEAEQKVAADHQAELASLKEEYEGRIAQLEQSIKSDMAVQIKDQLLKLADYRVTRSGDADAGMPESSQSQGHDVESTES